MEGDKYITRTENDAFDSRESLEQPFRLRRGHAAGEAKSSRRANPDVPISTLKEDKEKLGPRLHLSACVKERLRWSRIKKEKQSGDQETIASERFGANSLLYPSIKGLLSSFLASAVAARHFRSPGNDVCPGRCRCGSCS
jgi:hypothetical protein